VLGVIYAVIGVLSRPAYAIPLLLNVTGSVWFFILIGKAELSLTVPITNSLAFLFTVLGEWWAEKKVISRGTFRSSLGESSTAQSLTLHRHLDRHGTGAWWHCLVRTKQVVVYTRIEITSLPILCKSVARIRRVRPIPCCRYRCRLALKQPREALCGWLQPVSLVILLLALDNMERVYVPALLACVLLALVEDVAVDENQRASLDLTHIVRFLLVDHLIPLLVVALWCYALRKSGPVVVDEAGSIARSHKPLLNRSSLVAPSSKAKTPVFFGSILKGIPPTDRARRISIQECAILMGRHRTAYLGLLADDHGLEDSWIAEPERRGNGGIAIREGYGAKRRGELVQIVANLIDCAVFGLCQGAGFVECVCHCISSLASSRGGAG
jgi:hypothetical protein